MLSEVSKKTEKQIPHTIWSLLQLNVKNKNKNKVIDTEKGLVVASGKGWGVEEMSELFLICLFVSLNQLKKSAKLSFTPKFFGGKIWENNTKNRVN